MPRHCFVRSSVGSYMLIRAAHSLSVRAYSCKGRIYKDIYKEVSLERQEKSRGFCNLLFEMEEGTKIAGREGPRRRGVFRVKEDKFGAGGYGREGGTESREIDRREGAVQYFGTAALQFLIHHVLKLRF
jgi:hypothetical protein